MSILDSAEGKKLHEIYKDLSLNVTKIYNRPILHMGLDLIFHSVISFTFKGVRVQRGWLDVLVIGDTRTGKTWIARKLIEHYKVGELITGENISKAGLIGGLSQIGNNWMVNWGKLPINDKRLVILDEISGMTESLISELSGIRSSGLAEIVKIRSEKTFARVRLAWLSNPKGIRGINSYTYPVYAVRDLVRRPEDIARFDYCLIAKTDDVPLSVINAKNPEKTKHIYTSKLCNKLILWTWSRNPDQIKFTKEAEDTILDYATACGKKYSAEIPLMEPNEARIKIARIAIAIACRLFSTEDGISVIIRVPHVELAYRFIEEIYEELGYDKFSYAKNKETVIEDKEDILRALATYGQSFVSGLLDLNTIKIEDVMDYSGETYDGARAITTLFVKNRCIKRFRGIGYIKTPAFIELLNNWKPQDIEGL